MTEGQGSWYDEHRVWQRPAEGTQAPASWTVPATGWSGGDATGEPVGPAPTLTPAPAHTRWSTRARVAAAVSLLAVGAVAGGGISHAAFNTSAPASSAAAPVQAPATVPGTGTGSGSSTGSGALGGGSSTYGGSGTSPFGGTGDGSLPFSSQQGTGSASGSASDGPTDAAAIATNVDPGLVDITTTVTGGEAAGTGMALTSNGEILTNNHVIDGATSISVRDVGNNKTYKATVVGYDRTDDIAVLQLTNASGLTTVTISKTQPSVGAAVVGVGNAGGTGGTPSYAGGAVTALGQHITASDEYGGTSEQLTDLIATDAPIQAGDSGGPLVNASGQVIGVDTAASTSSGYAGASFGGASTTSQGFAIPINNALLLAAAIESGQSSSTVHVGPTAQLGVYIGAAADGTQQVAGAAVEQVVVGGPAASAGLAANDLITALNGKTVADANALSSIVTTLKPGQRVPVTYTDDAGTSHTATVTLGTGVPQ